MTKKHVDRENTASRPDGGKYASVIQEIAEHGVCPFCSEHLSKYHKNPIEERLYWLVTDNMYPYKPSLHHRLLIYKEHVTHIDQISSGAWQELREIIAAECARLDICGGTLICRFGDTKFTGASVSHLHAHIVQSDPDNPEYNKAKGLSMRIG